MKSSLLLFSPRFMRAGTAYEVEIFSDVEKLEDVEGGVLGLGGGEDYPLAPLLKLGEQLPYAGIDLVIPPAVDIVILTEEQDGTLRLLKAEAKLGHPGFDQGRAYKSAQRITLAKVYPHLARSKATTSYLFLSI